MCGIVGFVGKRKCVKSLIETLSKLEYRGYDSAGVSWFENQVIKTLKKTTESAKETPRALSTCLFRLLKSA